MLKNYSHIISSFFDGYGKNCALKSIRFEIILSGTFKQTGKESISKDKTRVSGFSMFNEFQTHTILSIIFEFFYPSYN